MCVLNSLHSRLLVRFLCFVCLNVDYTFYSDLYFSCSCNNIRCPYGSSSYESVLPSHSSELCQWSSERTPVPSTCQSKHNRNMNINPSLLHQRLFILSIKLFGLKKCPIIVKNAHYKSQSWCSHFVWPNSLLTYLTQLSVKSSHPRDSNQHVWHFCLKNIQLSRSLAS